MNLVWVLRYSPPLAQGLLTDKYLSGDVPLNSRAHENNYLKESAITAGLIARLEELRKIANIRGQSLAQMALAFALSQRSVSTVIIGARNAEQLMENIRSSHRSESFTFRSKNPINIWRKEHRRANRDSD